MNNYTRIGVPLFIRKQIQDLAWKLIALGNSLEYNDESLTLFKGMDALTDKELAIVTEWVGLAHYHRIVYGETEIECYIL